MNDLPLPKSRTLFLTGGINLKSTEDLVKSLKEIEDNDLHLIKLYHAYDLEYKPKPIKIIIDNYGGLVYQELGVCAVLDNMKIPVHTIVTGCAMSAGFNIAVHGHKRFAYKHATFMYHQVSSGAFGELKSMIESVEEVKRLHEISCNIVTKKTKIPRSILDENFERKIDWFMDAKEALKFGVIDEIIE